MKAMGQDFELLQQKLMAFARIAQNASQLESENEHKTKEIENLKSVLRKFSDDREALQEELENLTEQVEMNNNNVIGNMHSQDEVNALKMEFSDSLEHVLKEKEKSSLKRGRSSGN